MINSCIKTPALARSYAIVRTALLLFAGASVSAMLFMVWAHVTGDTSFAVVAEHTHSSTPFLFKLAAAWGSHEGATLMLIAMMGVVGAFLSKVVHNDEGLWAGIVHLIIGISFTIYMFLLSNPFARNFAPVADGRDLNPLLHDVGLAIHPPMVAFAQAGAAAVFAITLAFMFKGRDVRIWAQAIRPYALVTWGAFTVAITLGSWWAFRTLGWGGWWFWDPVENIALIPTLLATCLIHTLLATRRNGALAVASVSIGLAMFLSVLLGIFLVRSGLLVSVHSFALDPGRGILLLIILAIAILVALVTFALRYKIFAQPPPGLENHAEFATLSREGGIAVATLLIATAVLIILFGVLTPVLVSAFGLPEVSIGAPWYMITVVPLLAVLAFITGAGPWLRWTGGGESEIARGLAPAFIAVGCALIACIWYGVSKFSVFIAAALAAWSIVAIGNRIVLKKKLSSVALGHGGLALAIAGMMGSALMTEHTALLHIGQKAHYGNTTIELSAIKKQSSAGYETSKATVKVSEGKGNNNNITMHPEQRFYNVREVMISRADHSTGIWADYLGFLEDGNDETSRAIRIQKHPLVSWIWIGGIVASLGGVGFALIKNRQSRRKVAK